MSGPGDHRGRSRLQAEEILIAAVALIDAEGAGQLTMRRLGSSLGVEAMALYRYFPSRHVLLNALVESVVHQMSTDPGVQMLPDDDWRDYLDRLAHGVRQTALTHPRVFPLVATHPTEAPWLRPPIRSLRWVDSFLQGLQDHHFPPPAAVLVYKQFSTFLLGHLLLEVSTLGLDHPDEASAPPPPPDRDTRIAERDRRQRAERASQAMDGQSAPSADDIVEAATSRTTSVADEPAVQAADPVIATAVAAAQRTDGAGAVDSVAADVDIPIVAAVVSTSTIALQGFPQVSAMAGLLAQDTAARDFDRALGRLLEELASYRRP